MTAVVELFVAGTYYDEITIPRIAEKAGVSPQTVVLHFKTKDGLVEACAGWWKPREEELRDVGSSDPLGAARKMCERYETMGLPSLRLLAMEERVPAVAPLIAHGRASHRAWVERTFADKLGTGAARERRIMGLVVAYDAYTWDILRRRLSPEDMVHAMADLARGALDSKGGKR